MRVFEGNLQQCVLHSSWATTVLFRSASNSTPTYRFLHRMQILGAISVWRGHDRIFFKIILQKFQPKLKGKLNKDMVSHPAFSLAIGRIPCIVRSRFGQTPALFASPSFECRPELYPSAVVYTSTLFFLLLFTYHLLFSFFLPLFHLNLPFAVCNAPLQGQQQSGMPPGGGGGDGEKVRGLAAHPQRRNVFKNCVVSRLTMDFLYFLSPLRSCAKCRTNRPARHTAHPGDCKLPATLLLWSGQLCVCV